ncbi:hypothetical protein B0H10DRAFT_1969069 [Mycena sp. CBHHK59/15]|nr:hypothetical protein B0H10DRAFT_1969069 [Mycena sp. CBHHK59/15]
MQRNPPKRAKTRSTVDPRLFISSAAAESDDDESDWGAQSEDEGRASADEASEEYICRRAAMDVYSQESNVGKHYAPWAALRHDEISPEQFVEDLHLRHTSDAGFGRHTVLAVQLYKMKPLARVLYQAMDMTSKVWKVAVVAGHEADVVNTVLNVCCSKNVDTGIRSAIALGTERGFVYIEAIQLPAVEKLIKSVFFMRWKPVPTLLSDNDTNTLLWQQGGSVNLVHHDDCLRLTLWILPRVQRSESTRRPVHKHSKGAKRPSRSLFLEADLIAEGGRAEPLPVNNTSKHHFVFNDTLFHYGFVVMDVPVLHVRDVDVGETEDEVLLFQSSPLYAEIVVAARRQAEATNTVARAVRDLELSAYSGDGQWEQVRRLERAEEKITAYNKARSALVAVRYEIGRFPNKKDSREVHEYVDSLCVQEQACVCAVKDTDDLLKIAQLVRAPVAQSLGGPRFKSWFSHFSNMVASTHSCKTETSFETSAFWSASGKMVPPFVQILVQPLFQHDSNAALAEKADHLLMAQLPPTEMGLRLCKRTLLAPNFLQCSLVAHAAVELFRLPYDVEDPEELDDAESCFFIPSNMDDVQLFHCGQRLLKAFPSPLQLNFIREGQTVSLLAPHLEGKRGVVEELQPPDSIVVSMLNDDEVYDSPALRLVVSSQQVVADIQLGESVKICLGRYAMQIGTLVHTDWSNGTSLVFWCSARSVPINDSFPSAGSIHLNLSSDMASDLALKERVNSWIYRFKTRVSNVQNGCKCCITTIKPKRTVRDRYARMEIAVKKGHWKGNFGTVLGSREGGDIVDVVLENSHTQGPIPFDVSIVAERQDKERARLTAKVFPAERPDFLKKTSTIWPELEHTTWPRTVEVPYAPSPATDPALLTAVRNWLLNVRLAGKRLDVYIEGTLPSNYRDRKFEGQLGMLTMHTPPSKMTMIVEVRAAQFVHPLTTMECDEPKSSTSSPRVLETPGAWVVIIGTSLEGSQDHIGERGVVVAGNGEVGIVKLYATDVRFAASSVCRSNPGVAY